MQSLSRPGTIQNELTVQEKTSAAIWKKRLRNDTSVLDAAHQ